MVKLKIGRNILDIGDNDLILDIRSIFPVSAVTSGYAERFHGWIGRQKKTDGVYSICLFRCLYGGFWIRLRHFCGYLPTKKLSFNSILIYGSGLIWFL